MEVDYQEASCQLDLLLVDLLAALDLLVEVGKCCGKVSRRLEEVEEVLYLHICCFFL